MLDEPHLVIIKRGVATWNRWRADSRESMPSFVGADLRGLLLAGADLSCANLRGAKLCGANLEAANLFGADLSDTDLSAAAMSRASLRRARLRRSRVVGARLHGANCESADFSDADIAGAWMVRGYLDSAILDRANFEGTDLRMSDLSNATAHGTLFPNANLDGATLCRTDLRGANLSGASLIGTDLRWARVAGSNFTRAQAGWTCFAFIEELAAANALDTVTHCGPSEIGAHTLIRTGTQLSETFLRGIGLTPTIRDYMVSASVKPIQSYSAFISYSTDDQDFATRLYWDLRARNIDCWFAPMDVKAGQKIADQIDQAIRRYDKLLLILSKSSMRSAWVASEILKARSREKREKRQLLFPVRLVNMAQLRRWKLFDADLGEDVAREVRAYHIPDFSEWDEDEVKYRTALRRLLGDISRADLAR